MSDAMPPFPGMGAPGMGQPSEEEMRAALAQMRATPAEQFVAGTLQELLSAAQVKMGRNDGRLLLDVVAAVNEVARGHVDAQLTGQVDDALSQLRLAQVQAERELVQAATEGHVEHNDLPRRPAPSTVTREDAEVDTDAPAGDAGTTAPPPPAPTSAASRLWVPGR